MPYPDTKYEGTILGALFAVVVLVVLFVGAFEPSSRRAIEFLGLLIAVALAFLGIGVLIGAAKLRDRGRQFNSKEGDN